VVLKRRESDTVFVRESGYDEGATLYEVSCAAAAKLAS
jgi:hypothetical protein